MPDADVERERGGQGTGYPTLQAGCCCCATQGGSAPAAGRAGGQGCSVHHNPAERLNQLLQVGCHALVAGQPSQVAWGRRAGGVSKRARLPAGTRCRICLVEECVWRCLPVRPLAATAPHQPPSNPAAPNRSAAHQRRSSSSSPLSSTSRSVRGLRAHDKGRSEGAGSASSGAGTQHRCPNSGGPGALQQCCAGPQAAPAGPTLPICHPHTAQQKAAPHPLTRTPSV